eukprot:scaffold142801_cov163-Phaeocystis_antarctica.AAC.1
MSWHGQAEQPMMPRDRSVCAVVPDAQGPSPWTRLARRVWIAAVWPRSMHAPLRTSTIRLKTRGRAAGRLSRARPA